MNIAHAHLLFVHVPIVTVPVAAVIIYLGLKKNCADVVTTALVLFTFATLGCIAAYLTGEGAEDILKNMPEVAKSDIEAHEDAALFSLIGVLITGALSITALVLQRFFSGASHSLLKLILIFAVVSSALLAWTGNLGGAIRHTEIEHQ